MNHGFICVGGTKLHADAMKRLKVGDIIYAYVSRFGYVGIATVTKEAIPFGEAVLPRDDKQLKDMGLPGNYTASDDLEKCDYIALVEWEMAVPKEKACKETPISIGTVARVGDHRKDLVNKIRKALEAANVSSSIGEGPMNAAQP